MVVAGKSVKAEQMLSEPWLSPKSLRIAVDPGEAPPHFQKKAADLLFQRFKIFFEEIGLRRVGLGCECCQSARDNSV